MRKTYLFLTVLMLILFSMKQNAQVIPSDSLALVAFYNASGGDWDNTGTWLVDSVSKWAGIVVTGDRVTEINTEGFFPSGTIAPELGNLSELKVLKLIGLETGPVVADFNGSIPPEIWNLTNLEKLQIKYTNVTGGIPAGISTMVSLQEINFQQTYLEGTIPPELFELPSLVKAYLHQSNFTGTVPSTVTGATNLTRLYLQENKLEGPLPFVDLPDGQAKVQLTGNFFSFDDVKQYHDSAATFAGFTDDYQFAKEPVDTVVDHGSSFTISGTVANGEAYAWFKDDEAVPVATTAELSFTDFGLADEGTYTCKAQAAIVPNFDIRTVYTISDAVVGMERDSLALVDFYTMSGGNWDNTGTWLVDSVSKWSGIVVTGNRVTEINTEGFFPSGPISPLLGKLSELKVLKLIGLETGPVIADFNGSIPPEIWDLTNLEKLQIKYTNVTGGIPAGISSMDSLQEINFQQTYLEGTIPPELFELPSLVKAYLHQSNFTGTVPSTVTGATNLTRLYLQENKLEGPLPFVDLPDGQAKVQLTGNYFTFADVKQYHDSAATFAGFTDDYQFAQDTMFYADVDEGSSLTFDLYVPDGEAYAWFKGVEPTPISSDTSYTLDPVALTDTGTFVCKVQNATVANFDIRAAFVVENIIALPASPVFQSAYSSTDGTLINVDFDLDLADPSGEAGSFTVNIDGSPVTVSSAASDGSDASIVVLTLSSAVPNSTAAITVSYAPGTLQSTEGGMVAAFGPESATNNVPTGIENVETNFTVYPNPFTNTIRISSASKITYVGIFDISGNMIREYSASENTLLIQIDELNDGVYFLNIKSEDSSSIRKVIKQ